MNNEPAFPAPDKSEYEFGGDQRGCAYNGMTLRDYFAAQAMQVVIDMTDSKTMDEDARTAYRLADAMMKAREQT